MAAARARYGSNTGQMAAKHGSDAGPTRVKYGPMVVKYGSDPGQMLVVYWSNDVGAGRPAGCACGSGEEVCTGQVMVNYRSITGQILVKYRPCT